MISGISYTNAFNGFQKGGGVNIQAVEDGLKVDVLFLWLGIVLVLSHDNQVTVIPRQHVNIPLEAVRRTEADMVPSEAEGDEALGTTEDGLVVCGL